MNQFFKYLSFTFFFLTVYSTAFAGPIPAAWIRDEEARESTPFSFSSRFSSLVSGVSDSGASRDVEDLGEATKIYDNILDAKSDVVENSSGVSGKHRWYLQGISTEIGVSYDGQFGILGSSGEATADLYFVRTKEVVRELQKKYYGASTPPGGRGQPVLPPSGRADADGAEDAISFNSHMSRAELGRAVESVVTMADRSGKISNLSRFRRRLLTKVLDFGRVAGDLQHVQKWSAWYPYKFQLEIDFEASGDVLPYMQAGAAFRAYLEWEIIEKKNTQHADTFSAESISDASTLSDNSRMLIGLGQDLSTLDELSVARQSYELVAIRIGLGVTAEGNMVVADAQGAAIGSVFYRRDRSKNQSAPGLSSSSDILPIVSGDNRVYQASHKYFQKSLKKTIKIADFFARGALRNEERRKLKGKPSSFELKFIELEMTLSLNGGLGLATVGGRGVMHLFLAKHS
jgi:hypothetical protein